MELHFFIQANNLTEFKTWKKEFEELNRTTYSICFSKKCTGKYLNYKQVFKCQHNTHNIKHYEYERNIINKGTRQNKNTNCPSKFTMKIHAIKKRDRNKNKELGKLKRRKPCEIILVENHNHSTTSADALRFRRVSEDTRNKLIVLYKNGHTPSTALESLKIDIQLKHENYEMILADRYYCPDYNFCRNLYQKEFKKKYGPQQFDKNGQAFLQKRINDYNDSVKDGHCVKMELDENSNYVIW